MKDLALKLIQTLNTDQNYYIITDANSESLRIVDVDDLFLSVTLSKHFYRKRNFVSISTELFVPLDVWDKFKVRDVLNFIIIKKDLLSMGIEIKEDVIIVHHPIEILEDKIELAIKRMEKFVKVTSDMKTKISTYLSELRLIELN